MDNVVISMTHAKEHIRVYADVSRECAMLVNQSASLLTCGIEPAGK
jgi:hypothetical protein